MKIQSITNSNQTTFGNIIATPKVIKYIEASLNPKQLKKVNLMFAEQKGKKPDITLEIDTFMSGYLNAQSEHEYLKATVGQKEFTGRWFTSTFGVIKKAIRYANKFDGDLTIHQNNINTK